MRSYEISVVPAKASLPPGQKFFRDQVKRGSGESIASAIAAVIAKLDPSDVGLPLIVKVNALKDGRFDTTIATYHVDVIEAALALVVDPQGEGAADEQG